MPAHKKTFSPLKALGRAAKGKFIDQPLNDAKAKRDALAKGATGKLIGAVTARNARKPQSTCEHCGKGAHGKGGGRYCSPACARAAAKDMK